MSEVNVKFEELKDKIFTKIIVGKDICDGDFIVFITSTSEVYKMYHLQDVCESVSIEDICGDLNLLLNKPILVAEEAMNEYHKYDDSYTWTFYRLATIDTYVTIRWYGTSEGYYSEHVDFVKLGEEDARTYL